MKTVRILQIIDKIDKNSGVWSAVNNYYKHIDNSEFIFDFMVNQEVEENLKEEIEQRGSKIYVMPELKGKNMLQYKKELKSFFSTHKEYCIVHGHVPNASAFYLREAKKAGVPVRILHSHNSRGADGIVKKIRNYILNHRGVSAANVYLACSAPAAQYLFGTTDESRVRIVRNAIDLKKFAYNKEVRENLRKKYHVEDKFVIGHIGRFVEQKNHRFLIEIAKELKDRRRDFSFVLVGDGPLRLKIEQMVKKMGLSEYFIFVGSVDNPQDYYQMMDLFAMPSLYEGLPVVGVEAQAAGLPCLFSDTITREILLTKQAKQLSIQKADEWAEELSGVVKQRNLENVELIEQHGFAIEKEAKKLENIYLKLIGK